MDETRLVFLGLTVFWVLVVAAILLVGRRWQRLSGFRACMLDQWKAALVISGVYLAGYATAGRGILNPYAIVIFCEAWVGLALARSIPGFEALPAARAIQNRADRARTLLLTVLEPLLVVIPAMLIGTVGLSIGRQIFHEASLTSAQSTFSGDQWQLFFAFLTGAGIAEETPYRLVLVPLLIKLTGRRGLAVVISALVFGLYHITPLDGMYRTFLQFPISQVLASSLIGLVWGWLFLRRGYEAAVLGHTLSNWLPVLIFAR